MSNPLGSHETTRVSKGWKNNGRMFQPLEKTKRAFSKDWKTRAFIRFRGAGLVRGNRNESDFFDHFLSVFGQVDGDELVNR